LVNITECQYGHSATAPANRIEQRTTSTHSLTGDVELLRLCCTGIRPRLRSQSGYFYKSGPKSGCGHISVGFRICAGFVRRCCYETSAPPSTV